MRQHRHKFRPIYTGPVKEAVMTEQPKVSRTEKYPLHHKLQDLQGESQKIGNFISWLQEQGWWICEDEGKRDYSEYRPVRHTIEDLLGMYFEIDPKALSAEKDAMYDEMQRMRSAG